MINEIIQWTAIALLAFLLLYPTAKQVVQDFRNEEEE